MVLIETLWNVKTWADIEVALATGINRNIVECKDIKTLVTLVTRLRINRNIVECKVSLIIAGDRSSGTY